MNVNKGSIVPIILILLLLSLAGFFVFTQKVVESPVTPIKNIVVPKDVIIATSTQESLQDPVIEESEIENDGIATSSTTTTVSSSTIQDLNE